MRAWKLECTLLILLAGPACAWGPRTHQLVTDMAIDLVPAPCDALLRASRTDLLARSLEPDTILRERDGQREAVRHYIDLDAYMPYPFEGFPRHYRDAVRRYGSHPVRERGVVPWVILRFHKQLRAAYVANDRDGIVREAGHLSHYVADAHQPLHLTVNHDGQHSGNNGVHLRLEIGVVDDRIEHYQAALRGHLAPAQRLSDARAAVFEEITRTYLLVDPIMQADRAATGTLWPHGPFYYRQMHAALAPMIEQQLSRAATQLASIWYTACLEAKGDLDAAVPGQ